MANSRVGGPAGHTIPDERGANGRFVFFRLLKWAAAAEEEEEELVEEIGRGSRVLMRRGLPLERIEQGRPFAVDSAGVTREMQRV
jgi:hypothetical protein